LTWCWLLLCGIDAASLRGPEPLPSDNDGIYGRFESDLDAGLGLGAALASGDPAIAVRGTLHYFSTAGLQLGAEFPTGEGGSPLLSFGVDLRPAFLPRFSENMEQGPAWLDLALDSISLSIGPYFPLAPDPGSEKRGLDTSLGLGVPLFASASGPWLEARGLARIPDGPGDARFGALVFLSWHAAFDSPWLEEQR
jgi:hypothetical protein